MDKNPKKETDKNPKKETIPSLILEYIFLHKTPLIYFFHNQASRATITKFFVLSVFAHHIKQHWEGHFFLELPIVFIPDPENPNFLPGFRTVMQ